MAELEYLRDVGYPVPAAAAQPPGSAAARPTAAAARRTPARPRTSCSACQNSRKARVGGLAGLLDPTLMARKKRRREEARAQPSPRTPKLKDAAGAWDTIAEAQKIAPRTSRRLHHARRRRRLQHASCSASPARWSAPPRNAPSPTPSGCREFRESEPANRSSCSCSPRRRSTTTSRSLKLADSLGLPVRAARLRRPAGAEGAGRQVAARAGRRADQRHASSRTSAVRKKLVRGRQGGGRRRRNDPMIELARLVDAEARERPQDVRGRRSRSRSGRPTPRSPRPSSPSRAPTPTPTRRSRCGWPSARSRATRRTASRCRLQTTFAGLYERAEEHEQQAAVRPAARAGSSARSKLDLKTPFNFVCTADIIGGNSGSPVVNRDGEVVGLIFDGNIQSLVLDFVYTDEQARAVSVHSRGHHRGAAQGLRRRRPGGRDHRRQVAITRWRCRKPPEWTGADGPVRAVGPRSVFRPRN